MSLGMTGDMVVRGDAVFGKAAAKQDRSGAAVGAGLTIGTAGLLGGGVPGARPDSGRLAHVRHGTKYEASRHLVSAARGGVFGYRADAHQSYLNRQNADEAKHAGKKTTRPNHYLRGQGTGKIAPEKKIIQHMLRGRVASNYALAGGAALTAAGLGAHRRAQKVGKAQRRDTYRADMLATGGALTAAGAGAGSMVMDSQGRKWAARSAADLDAARAKNPKLGGYEIKRNGTRVPDVVPHKGTSAHVADKKTFAGRSSRATEEAGRLRGSAGQHRYFARVYGKTAVKARRVGVAGALVGAAGLGEKHLQVRKNLAAMKGARIPGVAAVMDNRGQVQFLSQLPKVHAGDPQRVLHTVRPRKRSLGRDRVSKVDVTMSDREAKTLAARYDTRGPLPKGLDRPTKMRAYEARYVASGGKKAEKWKRRADVAEAGRNAGLAGATIAAGGILASRGKRTGPVLARTKGVRHATSHRLETAGLVSGLGGGGSELYGEHARNRRASYNNSAAGVAASALTRMQGYTPKPKARS